MSDSEILTLGPKRYDSLGRIHCGVVKEGVVSVAGDIRNLDDGQEIDMQRGRVKVSRKGSEYTFTKYH